MKDKQKIWLVILISVGLLLGNISFVYAEETHNVQFFYENVCASCNESEKFYELFNRCISSEEKQTLSYEIRTYNLFLETDRKVYEDMLEESGKNKTDITLPVLVIDGQWISGYDKMEQELHGVLVEGKNVTTDSGQSEVNAEKNTETEQTETNQIESNQKEAASDFELPEITAQDDESSILLFSTYSCAECQEVKGFLGELSGTTDFAMTECSIAEGSNVGLFKELLKVYGIDEKDGKVPAVFVGEQALIGSAEIQEKLPGLLAGEESRSDILKKQLAKISGDGEIQGSNIGTLFAAGLLAGFNPCAISMLLMLFSILLTGKASVLKNGVLYLAAKYLTYFALGAGICFAASKVNQDFLAKFGKIMNVVIIVLFLTVAVLNFIDFLNVRKDEYGKVRMQLPKGLRRFNHKMIKKAEHMEGAFLGLLVVGLGIAISVGEFFCTGQIYMASILYLLRNASGQFLQIIGTLLIYVTAMSIPAVAIIAVIYRTRGTGKVSDFMLKHMGAIKLLNSILFAFYAVYFVVNL